MGINAEVIALLFGSAMVCVLAVVAAVVGISVLCGWDPDDSSRRQLARERRSLLIESTTRVLFAFQLISLAAFVAVIDRLHPLFPGAMCGVGTLNAHTLGYPTLLSKVVAFLLCALWLILNRATPGAQATGLVRLKHASLVLIAGALVFENLLQLRFFAGLRPDVLTSCCATVFNQNGRGIGSALSALPLRETRAVFFSSLALTLGAGLRFLRRGRSPAPYSILSVVLAGAAVAAILTWIAPAVYELPTHHCPLCLLGSGHRPLGYLLYLTLAVGLVGGAGAGLLGALRRVDRGGSIRVGEEKRLCATSMAGFVVFAVAGAWPMLASALSRGTS